MPNRFPGSHGSFALREYERTLLLRRPGFPCGRRSLTEENRFLEAGNLKASLPKDMYGTGKQSHGQRTIFSQGLCEICVETVAD